MPNDREFELRAINYAKEAIGGEVGLSAQVFRKNFINPKLLVGRPVALEHPLDEGGVSNQGDSDTVAAKYISAEQEHGALSAIFQDIWSNYEDARIKDRENIILASGNIYYIFDVDVTNNNAFFLLRSNLISYQKVGFLSTLSQGAVREIVSGHGGVFDEAVGDSIVALLVSVFDDEGWLALRVV